MSFRSLIRSSFYQMTHSAIGILHLIIPLLGVLVFIAYDAITAMSPMDQIGLYIEALAIVFPLVIAGLTAMTSEIEAKAGHYQMLLMTPGSKNWPHAAKLLGLIILGGISTMVAVMGYGVVFSLIGHMAWKGTFWFVLAIFLFISMIPLYVLTYTVSFMLGKGYALGMGIVGSLLSALLMTGLGDSIWYFLPWGIASRLAMVYVINDFSGGHSFQMLNLNQGLIGLGLMTGLFLIVKRLLFERWEGNQSED